MKLLVTQTSPRKYVVDQPSDGNDDADSGGVWGVCVGLVSGASFDASLPACLADFSGLAASLQ